MQPPVGIRASNLAIGRNSRALSLIGQAGLHRQAEIIHIGAEFSMIGFSRHSCLTSVKTQSEISMIEN
jgi:hypothetical protein